MLQQDYKSLPLQKQKPRSGFSHLLARLIKRFSIPSYLLPILFGISVGAATLILWQALLRHERTEIELNTQLQTANAKVQIAKQLQERMLDLVRIAKHWENQGKLSKVSWAADTELYVRQYKCFQAIEWVDPSDIVRWSVPQVKNEADRNQALKWQPREQSALAAARKERKVVVSHMVNLPQGGKGFLVYVPLFQGKNFEGFIVGVFRAQELFDTIFNESDNSFGNQYAIAIFDGNEQVYSHSLNNRLPDQEWGRETQIALNGVTWRLKVLPEPSLLAQRQSLLPTLTLVVGFLMASLLTWAIYLTQVAQRRAKLCEIVNLKMGRETAERQLAEKAFWEAEAKYRNIFENALEGIFQSTPDGRYISVNPALVSIYGYESARELITNLTNINTQLYVEPNRRAEFISLMEERDTILKFESQVYRQDGSIIWISENVRSIRQANSSLLYYEGIVEDITERKLAEQEVCKALKQEKELSELRASFISITSHEFRTPLTTIMSSADLLERYSHKWTEEKKLHHLHRIQNTVKQTTALLNDVLLIGKAQAGKLEFNPVPIDLEQFCRSIVEEMQLSVSYPCRISFISPSQCIERESSLLPLLDEKLLRHILSNLLSNAIKYSPEDSTVYFELNCDREEAILQIKDRGIGIPPEDIKLLFESFHRSKNVGEIPGTGLGLTIVKNAVDLHGGKIAVDSEVGVGTTFTVALPLKYDQALSEREQAMGTS